MKHWIFVVFLGLSFSAWSLEVDFEPFNVSNLRHQTEMNKFCEIHSSLFGSKCPLASGDMLLVHDKISQELVSVFSIQFVRERTTALLSGLFLVDFSERAEIYKAMFERIQQLSKENNSWKAVSWVAINREIFSRVAGLDEKEFPILFSWDEQLFAASSILNLPQRDKVEIKIIEPSKISNWNRVAGVLIATVVPMLICQGAQSYSHERPKRVVVASKPAPKAVRQVEVPRQQIPRRPIPEPVRVSTPTPAPVLSRAGQLIQNAERVIKQINMIKRGKSYGDISSLKNELIELEKSLKQLRQAEDLRSILSQINGCLRRVMP